MFRISAGSGYVVSDGSFQILPPLTPSKMGGELTPPLFGFDRAPFS